MDTHHAQGSTLIITMGLSGPPGGCVHTQARHVQSAYPGELSGVTELVVKMQNRNSNLGQTWTWWFSPSFASTLGLWAHRRGCVGLGEGKTLRKTSWRRRLLNQGVSLCPGTVRVFSLSQWVQHAMVTQAASQASLHTTRV